jgi:hypothetical protein
MHDIDSIDEKLIDDKFIAIGLVFEMLKRTIWKKHSIDGIYLNEAITRNMIVSYFHDIYRIKDYHQFTLVDGAKQACYWIKWIIKEKPVQFQLPLTQVTGGHRLVNENLAIAMGFASLSIGPNVVSADFVRLLQYTLHFRSFEEDTFLPACDLLWRISSAVKSGHASFLKPL